jgi:hypothetical protein
MWESYSSEREVWNGACTECYVRSLVGHPAVSAILQLVTQLGVLGISVGYLWNRMFISAS